MSEPKTDSAPPAGRAWRDRCLIIVPTGIVTAELAHVGRKSVTTQVCPECMWEGHDTDAVHCKYCGSRL